jgi:hypothetical protein
VERKKSVLIRTSRMSLLGTGTKITIVMTHAQLKEVLVYDFGPEDWMAWVAYSNSTKACFSLPI